MAKVKIEVTLLNFYSVHSHVEIVLKDTTTGKFYNIDRWKSRPKDTWQDDNGFFMHLIKSASSSLTFEIEADPKDIIQQWGKHWRETQPKEGVLKSNCADAVQWFLTKFANIPQPNLSNVSLDHLAAGIFWPSFIPCPVTLPGRIMSNAKFHIEARNNQEEYRRYSILALHMKMAIGILIVATSAIAIYVALNILTAGLASVVLASAFAVTGLMGAHGFFKNYNTLSAKRIAQTYGKTVSDEHSTSTSEPPKGILPVSGG